MRDGVVRAAATTGTRSEEEDRGLMARAASHASASVKSARIEQKSAACSTVDHAAQFARGDSSMNRRQFILAGGATLLSAAIRPGRALGQKAKRAAGSEITWHRHGDSKLFDQQAAAEASMQLVMSALAGVNLIHDVGYLESGLTASPEAMTYVDEMIDQVRFILRGVAVSDEANLLADIAEVGPRGSFLTCDSTLDKFREGTWMGPLTDRRRYEEWAEAGGMDAGARTRARTLELLRDHRPRPLDPSTREMMWRNAAGADRPA